MEKGEWR